ncbi:MULTISPECIES: MarR family transcriptional regulator [Oceanobacillus]|uniref:HTH-type transcriptional regulator YsmB n=1 Tax=Oceanobacillus kimchii TaxID=746691 RepID=A0ABQ5TIR6_9BACI|nr:MULTISPECIES: MarR family transcriptional regulator [Oceanobacillus]MBT2600894.1 MarR family transcriptional regulator [Oceanobacillus sp. ISL-74]MBT2650709.1 MarR family transcriptional regulator [Oceanobacillus sp. ISL-73]MCT1575648.1 MarR family transcriptional regulator [Oceanobacillus kimchii]MCT2137279.1 MarR family transcriptional regulator [Oceanobacillus kimchii]OEH55460.1 MarR family transcriptional regulator [Oceanobacillus sp. E9]
MKKNELSDSVNQMEKRLRYISGMIKQNGRKILNNYPITSPQFIALQWLLEEGDLTIGELSNRISHAFSTTTDLVDRMEKNELVERVRDTNDRRVVRIHLLEKGKHIIEEVIDKRQAYLGEVLTKFSEEEKNQLNHLLEFLYKEMKIVNEK